MMNEKVMIKNRSADYTKINIILIISAIVLTGSLSILLIIRQYPSVWFDEAYSIKIFTSDLKTIWEDIIADTHPPLYYFLMKFFTSVFGSGFRTIKAVHLIPVFATHLWSGVLVIRNKKIIGKRAAGVLTSLFIVGTFAPKQFMEQNVEIRMYSWAMFFVTMSGVYALKMILSDFKYGKDSVLFIILVLSAALTHYYALFCEVIICIFVFVFILKMKSDSGKRTAIIRLLIPGLIGYIWWLPFAFQQMKNIYRINWLNFKFSYIRGYLQELVGFNIYFEMLFSIVIISEACCSVFRSENAEDRELKNKFAAGLLFFSMPFLLIIIGVILSLTVQPFLILRYIFPSLGLMYMGFILIISCIRKRRWIYCTILSAVILFLLVRNYQAEFIKENRTGTKAVVQYLEEHAAQDDIFVTDIRGFIPFEPRTYDDREVSVLRYYFPGIPIVKENEFLSQIDTFEGTAWWFTQNREKSDMEKIPGHGFSVSEIFFGNIDNYYYFTLCKIQRVRDGIDQIK